jgi:hypothetical protein
MHCFMAIATSGLLLRPNILKRFEVKIYPIHTLVQKFVG